MSTPRYAVYYAPAEGGTLDLTASQWLGRSAYSNRRYPPAGLDSIAAPDQAAMTTEPRHYGFHATLKPPFALARGSSLDHLMRAAESFAAERSPILLNGLHTAAIGRFVALVPTVGSQQLEALAAECVRVFDRFRAPAGEAELARRRARGLTARQDELLLAWGYPFVMDQFRFHLTLTGPLPAERREAVASTLAQTFDPLCQPAFRVDSLAVFVQHDRQVDFEVLERFPFGGADPY